MSDRKPKKAFENPDFLRSKEARPIRIASEYMEPEKRFEEENVRHTIVFFGSARTLPDGDDKFGTNENYIAAEQFAYDLAKLNERIHEEAGDNFYICTGGGPGIMEAANKGAQKAGQKTIGLNIDLPFEQSSNPYITPELNFEFHYFFTRKLWFLYQAKAIVVFPGGFGTMDELFETLTLIQTEKLQKRNIPVLLFNRKFWKDLINFDKFVDMGLISPEDLELFNYFDTPEEGIEILKPKLIHSIKNFKDLLYRPNKV